MGFIGPISANVGISGNVSTVSSYPKAASTQTLKTVAFNGISNGSSIGIVPTSGKTYYCLGFIYTASAAGTNGFQNNNTGSWLALTTSQSTQSPSGSCPIFSMLGDGAKAITFNNTGGGTATGTMWGYEE